MAYQAVFKRYELKYMLNEAQKQLILSAMDGHMKLDDYGETIIRNLYYDTDDYRLIRRSMEKPVYKEKLRIRSYRRAGIDDPVYVELKKKYKHVVYKRRLQMPEGEALKWLAQGEAAPQDSQIAREITYFRDFYKGLKPKVFLSYHRLAYYDLEGSSFRVTFDTEICARQQDLTLDSEPGGTSLLPEGMTLMELKCAGAMPLWMAHALNEGKIYKTSFSKYGTAFATMIFPQMKEEKQDA